MPVGYLPGLALRRIADLHPSRGNDDARGAFVIADAARTMQAEGCATGARDSRTDST
jgi:hypothetical protein